MKRSVLAAFAALALAGRMEAARPVVGRRAERELVICETRKRKE